MATALSNGNDAGGLRERPARLKEQQFSGITTPATLDRALSNASRSGLSTPLAEDAPPSVQSLSSARKEARAQGQHQSFYNIKYEPRLSHFDPNSDNHDFKGFFVLFWISLAIMVVTTVLRNIRDTGFPLRVQVWSLFTPNVVQLAFCDLAMVLSTGVTLPLHRAIRSSEGLFRWSREGMVVQSIYQSVWLVFWVVLPFILDFTWTAQVFFILHTITFLMKMHSYAFYNGHLSETQRRLASLDQPESDSLDAAIRYPEPTTPPKEETSESDDEGEMSVSKLRADLASELTSPLGNVTYPRNLTVSNYIDFILCPTLCYELEYPRTKETRWMEVFKKTMGVFGCIFLMVVTSEEFIVPVLNQSANELHTSGSASERALILAETISFLLFPFMVSFLLVFLVIFEYALGAAAEITRFADRRFYSDWWNSCDWLEFSREWNIPVHHFLRRHVYFSSLSRFSSPIALMITFFVSSIAHELVMACITKKIRGYGFGAMMLQLPIVAIQRSKFVKGKKTFNNVCFWTSMLIGLSMMCALYVLV